MNSPQFHLPLPSILSKRWPLIVIDLTVYVFTISLKKKTEKILSLQNLLMIILSLLKDINGRFFPGNVK